MSPDPHLLGVRIGIERPVISVELHPSVIGHHLEGVLPIHFLVVHDPDPEGVV